MARCPHGGSRRRVRQWARETCVCICIGVVLVVGCSSAKSGATGAVTGFIEPCVGTASHRVPSAAGTVIASRGVGRLQPVTGGEPQIAPNNNVAARQHVNKNQAYRLVLAPGPYVLTASYDESGVPETFFAVTVAPGATLHRNLGTTCK